MQSPGHNFQTSLFASCYDGYLSSKPIAASSFDVRLLRLKLLLHRLQLRPLLTLALFVFALPLQAEPMQAYVEASDVSYRWTPVERLRGEDLLLDRLELVSQTWRGHRWLHHLQLVRPNQVRNPDIAFLLIAGDGDGSEQMALLEQVAKRSGGIAAVVTDVPNQPFYEGRREDALIAYTLDRYLKTGDFTWPLLFPMVKGVVRAMDTVQAFAQAEFGQRITRFILAGASKRGWTTWLTAAVDQRIVGIAPMVFDMLNISAQTEWARKVYGQQSEKIGDYTDLGLVKKKEEESPRMTELRRWIDPYTYRERYTMPKLLLLGTNDPYWTVDSVRHYWQELPEPKLLFQTPNAGHDLAGGQDAAQSLAAFCQIIADRNELPDLQWQFKEPDQAEAKVAVIVDQPVKTFRLWTADSGDRDFRNDRWTSRELPIQPGSAKTSTRVPTPEVGYRAYFVEAELATPTGYRYRLSTQVNVTPDNVR